MLHLDFTIDPKIIGGEGFIRSWWPGCTRISACFQLFCGYRFALTGSWSLPVARTACLLALAAFVWSDLEHRSGGFKCGRELSESRVLCQILSAGRWSLCSYYERSYEIYLSCIGRGLWFEPIFVGPSALSAVFNYLVIESYIRGQWPERRRLVDAVPRLRGSRYQLASLRAWDCVVGWLHLSFSAGKTGGIPSTQSNRLYVVVSILVALGFATATGLINTERMGEPDSRFHLCNTILIFSKDAHVVEVRAEHGAFQLVRVPFVGMLYYVTGLPIKKAVHQFHRQQLFNMSRGHGYHCYLYALTALSTCWVGYWFAILVAKRLRITVPAVLSIRSCNQSPPCSFLVFRTWHCGTHWICLGCWEPLLPSDAVDC